MIIFFGLSITDSTRKQDLLSTVEYMMPWAYIILLSNFYRLSKTGQTELYQIHLDKIGHKFDNIRDIELGQVEGDEIIRQRDRYDTKLSKIQKKDHKRLERKHLQAHQRDLDPIYQSNEEMLESKGNFKYSEQSITESIVTSDIEKCKGKIIPVTDLVNHPNREDDRSLDSNNLHLADN